MSTTLHSTASRLSRPLALVAVSLLALSACSSNGSGGSEGSTSSASSSASPESSAAASTSASTAATGGAKGPLEVESPWTKAKGSGMTGSFGELTNTSDKPVTVVGASAEGVAGAVELHETVADSSSGSTTMQKVEKGFTVEPGETLSLKPGGDHIMLMDLACGLEAGTDLHVVLELSDGSTETLHSTVKDYAGAKEEYAPGEEHSASADTGGHGAGSHGEASAEADALPACDAH